MIEIFSAISSAGEDASNSPFVRMIIQMLAYVVPFFLIPATFKFGLGVFGNLAGRINDRGRGFFDKQSKRRQEIRAGNKQRMVQGERFNNRGLNALTSRATTKRLGLTQQGREAYQQKMNLAGAEFGKTAAGQALQHNDSALRALTYASEAEARANMARDFGMNEGDINTAVAAAKASGGFGRNRQVWAAQQLAATGTGYDNLEQVSKTIARAAHGNTSQASALAGNINSTTKSVGRFDLAPGFGQLDGLAKAEMSGGGATKAQYREATVKAARGADAVSILRGKPQEVQQFTQALTDHAAATAATMNNTGVSQQIRDAAREEFVLTMGQIDQLNQSKSYASIENQQHVNTLLGDTQQFRTQELDQVLGRTYDASGNRTDMHTVVDSKGRTVQTGMPGSGVSQEQINAREQYEQVRSPRYNPNDPNNQN